MLSKEGGLPATVARGTVGDANVSTPPLSNETPIESLAAGCKHQQQNQPHLSVVKFGSPLSCAATTAGLVALHLSSFESRFCLTEEMGPLLSSPHL